MKRMALWLLSGRFAGPGGPQAGQGWELERQFEAGLDVSGR